MAFLAYLIWDPVPMYNAVTNSWQDFEHQITFDVPQDTVVYTGSFALHPEANEIKWYNL